jgi:membrane protease YdiL (CAAX protease family)
MFQTLDVDFSWESNDLMSFLPIVVFFIMYWFTAQSPKIKKYFFDKYEFDQAALNHIFFTKIFGFVVMGIIPVTICVIFLDIPFAKYGLTIIPETTMYSLAWIVGLSVLVIPLVHFSAKKAKNLVNYPQVRSKVWTRKMVIKNATGWFLYLFGYEFLFRGVLLIPLVHPEFGIGIWAAIAVNIALYSATHIPKGLDETIGAIPLGLVLCLLTLASGTIWIAFIVHVAMAWTNFFTALKFNPETNYVKS